MYNSLMAINTCTVELYSDRPIHCGLYSFLKYMGITILDNHFGHTCACPSGLIEVVLIEVGLIRQVL